MKKIFAIALAVVMVLSMASAFALSQCATWGTNWDCTADDLWCGKGTIEVVPYVKVNGSCGVEFQVSDCATAIMTENVFWAFKLTVDAYPDPEWWGAAWIDFEALGLEDYAWEYEDGADELHNLEGWGLDLTADEEVVYYIAENGRLVDSSVKGFDIENVMWESEVAEGTVCDKDAVSVCASLNSYFDGFGNGLRMEMGDYVVQFTLNPGSSWATCFNADGEFTGTLNIFGEDADEVVRFFVVDGVIEGDYREDNAFYNEVLADFGLVNCGTAACITEDNIEANFGWDDEQEDCFAWSDKGMAVVDTDCVVAIPKTGDASVLAWLF